MYFNKNNLFLLIVVDITILEQSLVIVSNIITNFEKNHN